MRDDSPQTPRPESHRASLRGRGWEILRGQEPPPESVESPTEPAVAFEPEAAVEVEPMLEALVEPVSDVDLEDLLDLEPEVELEAEPVLEDLALPEFDAEVPQPEAVHADLAGPLSQEPPDDPLDWLLEPHLDMPLDEADLVLDDEADLLDQVFESEPDASSEVVAAVEAEPQAAIELSSLEDTPPPEEAPGDDTAADLLTSPELSKLQRSPAPPPTDGEALPLPGDAQAPAQQPLVYAALPEVEALTPAVEELDEAEIAALAGAAPEPEPEPAPEPVAEVEVAEAPPLAVAAEPAGAAYAPPPEVEALIPAAEEMDDAEITALAETAPEPAPEPAAEVEVAEAPPLAVAAEPAGAAYAPLPEVEALIPAAEELVDTEPEPVAEVEVVEAPPLAVAPGTAEPAVAAYAPPPEVEAMTPAVPEELGHVPEGIAEQAAMNQTEVDALAAELDALLAEPDALPPEDELPALDDFSALEDTDSYPPLEDDFFLPDEETARLDRSRLDEGALEALDVEVEITAPTSAQSGVPGLRVLDAAPALPLGGVGIAIPQDVRIDAARLAPPTARSPGGDLAPQTDDLVHKLVTDERLEKLWAELEAAQDAVSARAGEFPAQAERWQQMLLQASSLLLQDRAHYDDARALVTHVRASLAHQKLVEESIARYRPQITLFLVFMLALWLLLLALEPVFRQFMQSINLTALAFVYHPALFGMLGGIVAAYLALYKHTLRQRDFNAAYVSWYLMAPLAGLITGLLTTLLVAAAIISTLQQPSSLNDLPFLLWLVAFVAGFYHNALLGRLNFWRRGSESTDTSRDDGG